MRIVVDINHPGHVHYFKNFIREMKQRGHEIIITASHKDVATQLLQLYGLDYVDLGSYGISPFQKLINIPIMDIKMYRAVKDFRPDILLGFSSIRAAHASKFLGVPAVIFDDTEHAAWEHLLYVPFSTVIMTPSCFRKDLGEKQVRFDSYMELAALHSACFTPDPSVLSEVGLTENDTFIVVRFVAWQASHDIGQRGVRDKVGLVKALERYGRVLITSEGAVPPELQHYQIRISPEKLHDLLYYATLYVGEGGTTASEAASLGTHAIHVSTTAKHCGIFRDLNQYELLWTSESDDDTLKKAIELLRNPELRNAGRHKRDRLNHEKMNITTFMIWFVENFPGSVGIMKERPDFQNNFSI
ncbi:DUF354 domain-containing protein [Methanoculleus sp.]|uniref:DUF354 domain-containing protein n=1 Tax=Methanoculleus sp. TaxID=90427 RepID=UPI0025CF1C8D|nr:DUF354 domain-containing protein [Methanoculleus sp.]